MTDPIFPAPIPLRIPAVAIDNPGRDSTVPIRQSNNNKFLFQAISLIPSIDQTLTETISNKINSRQEWKRIPGAPTCSLDASHFAIDEHRGPITSLPSGILCRLRTTHHRITQPQIIRL